MDSDSVRLAKSNRISFQDDGCKPKVVSSCKFSQLIQTAPGYAETRWTITTEITKIAHISIIYWLTLKSLTVPILASGTLASSKMAVTCLIFLLSSLAVVVYSTRLLHWHAYSSTLCFVNMHMVHWHDAYSVPMNKRIGRHRHPYIAVVVNTSTYRPVEVCRTVGFQNCWTISLLLSLLCLKFVCLYLIKLLH